MREIGDAAHFFDCDVANPEAIRQSVDGVVRALGRIDACVAAAGILETPSTILDMDPEQHDRLWQINYNGTVHTCRTVGKVMADQGSGAMVTLGSINSFVPLPLAAYCPSKTAILRLTEMLAVEMGRFGVRVNGVAPTYVMTPAIKARIESGERDAQAIRDSNALGILVEPEDIAAVIHFLCSDAARAMSGQMIPIDAAHMSPIAWAASQRNGRKITRFSTEFPCTRKARSNSSCPAQAGAGILCLPRMVPVRAA